MKASVSRRVFVVCNYIFLAVVAFICIAPLWHVLCISLSDNRYAVSGQVGLWPRGTNLSAYSYLLKKADFFTAFRVSVLRVVLGSAINMLFCIITAYPLSRRTEDFHLRTVYVWYFAITMFWGGGLIPTYFVVMKTGVADTIWALVLPGALNMWHCTMMMNFFRGIPIELEEAAQLDGAGHIRILFHIFLPLTTASMATILLFSAVGHWNSWFDGMLYMNNADKYPLQTYLTSLLNAVSISNTNKVMMTQDEIEALSKINEKTLRMSQVFVGALPIMCVYPFLQRYFVKGMVVGSVKG